jgi:hypothetical protein
LHTRERAAGILADGGWDDDTIRVALAAAEDTGSAELDSDWRVIYAEGVPHAPFILTCAEPD